MSASLKQSCKIIYWREAAVQSSHCQRQIALPNSHRQIISTSVSQLRLRKQMRHLQHSKAHKPHQDHQSASPTVTGVWRCAYQPYLPGRVTTGAQPEPVLSSNQNFNKSFPCQPRSCQAADCPGRPVEGGRSISNISPPSANNLRKLACPDPGAEKGILPSPHGNNVSDLPQDLLCAGHSEGTTLLHVEHLDYSIIHQHGVAP